MKKVLSRASKFINALILGLILILSSPFAYADSVYVDLDQTTANLPAAGVYTSPVFQSHSLKTLNVNISSDVDSETYGLKINYVNIDGDCGSFTPTSSNMDYTAKGVGWTYTASEKASYQSSARGNCAWVTYTNGGAPQTTFKLTIFGNLE